MVSVREDWDEVIRQILDSKFVNIHITTWTNRCRSFGIPACYLKVSDTEPLFKYSDYYYGTKPSQFQICNLSGRSIADGRPTST